MPCVKTDIIINCNSWVRDFLSVIKKHLSYSSENWRNQIVHKTIIKIHFHPRNLQMGSNPLVVNMLWWAARLILAMISLFEIIQ